MALFWKLIPSIVGCVVTSSDDSLTSHMLGGFNSLFSSGRICCQCMATKASISDMLSQNDCILRTTEGDAYHLDTVEKDSTLSAAYGVKHASPSAKREKLQNVTGTASDGSRKAGETKRMGRPKSKA